MTSKRDKAYDSHTRLARFLYDHVVDSLDYQYNHTNFELSRAMIHTGSKAYDAIYARMFNTNGSPNHTIKFRIDEHHIDDLNRYLIECSIHDQQFGMLLQNTYPPHNELINLVVDIDSDMTYDSDMDDIVKLIRSIIAAVNEAFDFNKDTKSRKTNKISRPSKSIQYPIILGRTNKAKIHLHFTDIVVNHADINHISALVKHIKHTVLTTLFMTSKEVDKIVDGAPTLNGKIRYVLANKVTNSDGADPKSIYIPYKMHKTKGLIPMVDTSVPFTDMLKDMRDDDHIMDIYRSIVTTVFDSDAIPTMYSTVIENLVETYKYIATHSYVDEKLGKQLLVTLSDDQIRKMLADYGVDGYTSLVREPTNNGSISVRVVNSDSKTTSIYCPVCKRQHDRDNLQLYENRKGIILFCYRAKNGIPIYKRPSSESIASYNDKFKDHEKYRKSYLEKLESEITAGEAVIDDVKYYISRFYRYYIDLSGSKTSSLARRRGVICFEYHKGTNKVKRYELTAEKDITPDLYTTIMYYINTSKGPLAVKADVLNLWKKHTIDKIELYFDPSLDATPMLLENSRFNLFMGFRYTYDELRSFYDEYSNTAEFNTVIRWYRYHVLTMFASGFKPFADYFFDYWRYILRNPGKRTGIALVLIGDQGTGKSMFFSKIIGHYLGPYYMETTIRNIDEWRGIIDNKLFVYLDEFSSTRKSIEESGNSENSTLKDLITSAGFMANNKYERLKEIDLRLNVGIANNAKYFVTDGEGRRFTISKTTSTISYVKKGTLRMGKKYIYRLSKAIGSMFYDDYIKFIHTKGIPTSYKPDDPRDDAYEENYVNEYYFNYMNIQSDNDNDIQLSEFRKKCFYTYLMFDDSLGRTFKPHNYLNTPTRFQTIIMSERDALSFYSAMYYRLIEDMEQGDESFMKNDKQLLYYNSMSIDALSETLANSVIKSAQIRNHIVELIHNDLEKASNSSVGAVKSGLRFIDVFSHTIYRDRSGVHEYVIIPGKAKIEHFIVKAITPGLDPSTIFADYKRAMEYDKSLQ